MDLPNPQMDKSLDDSSKKSILDDLTRDELVKKCKGLLIIAQKAKQAKTDLSGEYNTLKEKHQQLETQKHADTESLKTMQEFVDTLTEQKLCFTTEIDALKKQNVQQKSIIKEKQDEIDKIISLHETQLKSLKNDLRNSSESLSKLDTEVTSLRRQNIRLEKDNEELIKQLDQLENEIETMNQVGLEQKKQLLELETNVKVSSVPDVSQSQIDSENLTKELDFFKNSLQQVLEEKTKMTQSFDTVKKQFESKTGELSKMEEEISNLKTMLDSKCLALTETENSLSQKDQELTDNMKLCETEKVKKDRLNAKLKLYKEKIIKCSNSITQLKNSKFVLLKTVSEYSESVPKWQKDILNASKLLSEQLLCLEAENNILKNKLADTNTNSSDNFDKAIVDSLRIEIEQAERQLSDVNDELETMNKRNEELTGSLSVMSNDKETLLQNMKSLESEKLILINEKKSAREIIQKNETEKSRLLNMCDELNDKISRLSSEVINLNESINVLETEKINVTEECDSLKLNQALAENSLVASLKEEVTKLNLSLVSVEEENKLLCEANETLKIKVEELTASLDEPNPEIVEHNNMLQADISKLETKIASYKTENNSLLFEIKESRQRLSELESTLQEFEDMKAKISNYKSENVELLNEMKEINQVLKERGETISRQDMEVTETNKKIKMLEEEIKQIKEEKDTKNKEIKEIETRLQEKESRLKLVDVQKKVESDEILHNLKMDKENLEALLKERDAIIISLNEDIGKLKQNQGNYSFDTPSESMSISTVSKVEESSRLKDLDESFEERYSKLRLLALKLKKRVGELTVQVKTIEEEKAKLSAKLEAVGEYPKNTNLSKSIQMEYDKAVDELEQKETEIKSNDKLIQSLKVEVEKLNQDLACSSDKIKDYEDEIIIAKREKAAFEMAVKELQSQITTAMKGCDSVKGKDAEILQLKGELASKESQLSVELVSHQSTKEALEKARKDVKKKSVLSLEMEDYERSMKDLTAKMEEDKKKIVQMESTIDTQDATITSVKTQIKMLEEQLNMEEKVTREMKELLNTATENLKEKECIINSKQDFVLELERKLEESNLQMEDINLQLTSALGEKEKSALSLGQEKLDLMARLKRNENRCGEIEEKLRLKTIELEDLKAEFAGYKVRAQSVLRQNQTKDLSLEENLKEEMAALKAELEALRPELQSTKEELEVVIMERTRLASRCAELQNNLQHERELSATQLQREAQEQKTIKLQMTTLTQCYKKQIAELEERTSEEISNLRKELEFSRMSLERANTISQDLAALEKKKPQFSPNANVTDTNSNDRNPTSDANDSIGEINVALLQREEGEGSESTPSPSPTNMSRSASGTKQVSSGTSTSGSARSRREPVPLEQLLEAGVPEEAYNEGDLETRLEAALRQIETQDKRLTHMTEIVAEAEREVARRAQLGEALKEEVRRCQRALDRALHHHNQEYLKNVIVKFLTLGAGDERSRLVPVLHTILTLSPEETQQLTAVAKGLDPNSNRGWGSYLPWPGKS